MEQHLTKKIKQLSPRGILTGVSILSALPVLIVVLFPDRFNLVVAAASYVVFHNTAEFFSIIVCLSIFGVGWYTYEQTRDAHLLFLSTALLSIGFIDFMHAMSNTAMPAFVTPNSSNKSSQYWIAARLFQACAFLISAFIYGEKQGRRLSKTAMITPALLLPALVFAGITWFPSYMPDTFIQGAGLTAFKKYSEYVVIALLCAASAAYWRRMTATGDTLLLYYLAAFIISIFSELCFAIYTKVFDTYNVLGHIYKVAAFFLIYKGVFIASVKEPYIKLEEGEHARHLASFPQLSPDPVLEIASSGKIIFFNPATEKTLANLGKDRNDPDIFLPKDIDVILRELKKKKEQVLYREITIQDRVFGQTIYLTPRFNVVRIYINDITERERAERAMEARLRLSETASKRALSTDEVLRLTLDELEIQTGSKIGFYHFLEEDQETLSLRNWSTNTVSYMCTAEGSGSHYNISRGGVWVDCVRERRPVIHNDYASLPYKKDLPKGHANVVREMVVPIFRGGRIVALIGVGNKETDYTSADVEMARLFGDFSWEIVERKRAEEALRESEEWYRGLFENMIEGFAYCRMLFEHGKPQDFIYLSVNHAFESLTGLTNVSGKRVTEVILGIRESDPEIFDIYGRVSLTGKSERFELYLEALKMWLSISVYSPKKEFFVAVFDVITERKKAEADILKLNQDMAARNAALESVNKELASFIYSVSHDLRAPIRTMAGFSEIMVEDYADKIDARGKDYLARIHAGSEKMARLIEDLLKLSRITRIDIDTIDMDLSGKAAAVIADLRESAPRANVEIIIQPDVKASADPHLIEIVLSNILGNAWKFTSKTAQGRIEFGAVKKNVRSDESSASSAETLGDRNKNTGNSELRTSNSELVYFVRDNGAGFDQAYAEKMFQPFHRLHSDTEFEGTGIGLAIVERIIHRHGGKIWAEGKPDKGATFYFTL